MSEENDTIFVEHLEQCLTEKKSMYPVLHFIIPLAQELLITTGSAHGGHSAMFGSV